MWLVKRVDFSGQVPYPERVSSNWLAEINHESVEKMTAPMTAPSKPIRSLFTDFKVFSGTANNRLTEGICKALDCSLGDAMIRRFADGEVHLQIQENVRGTDVFVVQPTCTPVNEHLMELLLMIDAFKRASAERITAVLPYYGYARQDRKDRPRMPISAKLVASLLERAGASRVLALDLHAAQIQGFFDIPVDHLFSAPVMVEYFENHFERGELIIVSPDAGGVERARSFAKRMNAPLAIIDKRRTDANVAEVMNIIGDVSGKHCLMVDDLVDTAGTLVKGVEALLSQGAKSVRACATHAVLSGPAVERITSSQLLELVVTDSIPLSKEAAGCHKIRVLSVASLLARAIQSIHEGGSISTLFI
jgi:ribose-phosphate pyrophosphokinase